MKQIFILAAALFVIIGLSSLLNAEMYQWTDENGAVHFSDSPVDLKDKGEVEVRSSIERSPDIDDGLQNMESDYENKMQEIEDLKRKNEEERQKESLSRQKELARQREEREAKIQELEADLKEKEEELEDSVSRGVSKHGNWRDNDALGIAAKQGAVNRAREALNRETGYTPPPKNTNDDREFELEQEKRRLEFEQQQMKNRIDDLERKNRWSH